MPYIGGSGTVRRGWVVYGMARCGSVRRGMVKLNPASATARDFFSGILDFIPIFAVYW